MCDNNTRDDFSDDTKRIAGERVCLRCSICGCPTKAASNDGSDKVASIGVAAHITAAAPGGPRYDPSITPEQRKSVDNCIWLCQNHARLIDRDIAKYPVERLLSIKKEAETKAAQALENGINHINNIRAHGFNIETTFNILNGCVKNGDYLQLKILLDSIEASENDEYSDLVAFFQVVYAFYCDRNSLDKSLDDYLQRENRRYIDNLVELFSQFFEVNYLRIVIQLCDNKDILTVAQSVIDGSLVNSLKPYNEIDDVSKIQDTKIQINSLTHKCLTNIAIYKGIPSFVDLNGIEIPFYNGEYYYKKRLEIVSLRERTIQLLNLNEQNLIDCEEFSSFLNDIDKIKSLDAKLQVFFWENILNIANCIDSPNVYDRLYTECREEIRADEKILPIILIHNIKQDVISVVFDEIRAICEHSKSYRLMVIYLNELIYVDVNLAYKIFNENKYILSKDSALLDIYIQLQKVRHNNRFSNVNFLLSYYNVYLEDFSYHVLVASYLVDNNRHKTKLNEELEWIGKRIDKLTFELPDLNRLICVYIKTEKYEELIKLGQMEPPIMYQFQIANGLLSSDEIKYISVAKDILLKISNRYPNIKGLNRGLFYCYNKLGDIANAKIFLCKEIDIDPRKEDYYNLLLIRLLTNEFIIDSYAVKAMNVCDAKIYHLLGETYARLNDIETSKDFLLKSLLMDEANEGCMFSYMDICLKTDSKEPPSNVTAGVTVTIKNDNEIRLLSIHKDGFFSKFKPNNFARCEHLEESDFIVQDIILGQVGDNVQYKNNDYKIDSLMWNEGILTAFIMSYLIENKKATAIQGETPELAVNELVKLVNKISNDSKEAVDLYNKRDTKPPLTMFCSMIGKKYVEMLDFLLFENSAILRSVNSNYSMDESNIYILSPEIIYTLACLKIDCSTLNQVNCICPLITKRTIIKELDMLIDDCKNQKKVGQLFSKNGKTYRDEFTTAKRKERLKFLNSLKKLIESLKSPKEEYSYNDNDELREVFVKCNLYLEGDLLGCAQNIDNAVLVDDDSFVSAIALGKQIPLFGINRFLIALDLGIEKHIEYLKKMTCMNYGNYLTPDVYAHLKRKILGLTDENQQNEYLLMLFDFITSKFLEEGSKKWHYNNAIVRSLANSIGENYDKFDEFVLRRAVVYNYSREYPEEFKAKIEEISKKKFIVTTRTEGDKIIFETHIED